jgi:putative glycosyltransferase (TIGR04372 family)
MRKLITRFVYFLPSIIIILIALIIKPFKNIKFCRADMSRLGGITFLDWYLSLNKLKKQKSEIIICFYDSTINHINCYWFKIWRKKIFFLKNPAFFDVLNFLVFQFKINQTLLINDKFLNQKKFIKNNSLVELKYYKDLYNNYIKDYKPNIDIPKSDIEKEKFLLRSLNLKKLKYVCFHNRDESFLYRNSNNQNWSHHSFRNSNIENYVDAASYINDQNFKSIRVGKETEIKLSQKFIYDYANSKYQNDFADICVVKNCSFFVCSDTGISNVAECFRKPIVYVNFAVFNDLFNVSTISKGLIIFKKIYDTNSKKYLKFDDLKNLNIRGSNILEIIKQNNLKIEENSASEILEVTKEMYLRQIGNWQTNVNDDNKQKYFWNKYFPGFNTSLSLKVGKKYLEENLN